ncbi:MAG: GNAT family N-acetyltransferase [Ilumatobacteraceae bacterium]
MTASETHPLRLAVLRTGTTSRDPVYPGDELASTRHLAIADQDGRLVAVSTWIVEPFPDEADGTGLHLRGMATDEAHRGRGLGAALLGAGRARATELGADTVWARRASRHGRSTSGTDFASSVTSSSTRRQGSPTSSPAVRDRMTLRRFRNRPSITPHAGEEVTTCTQIRPRCGCERTSCDRSP